MLNILAWMAVLTLDSQDGYCKRHTKFYDLVYCKVV